MSLRCPPTMSFVAPGSPTSTRLLTRISIPFVRSVLWYYHPTVVSDWSAGVNSNMYAQAMAVGEVFFIAIRESNDRLEVLGFSSHRIDEGPHGVGVYVRGSAARVGIGSALLRAAELSAIAAGAASIQLDSSLAAVEFYKANGFEEIGRGEHRLSSGQTMACVFMRKSL